MHIHSVNINLQLLLEVIRETYLDQCEVLYFEFGHLVHISPIYCELTAVDFDHFRCWQLGGRTEGRHDLLWLAQRRSYVGLPAFIENCRGDADLIRNYREPDCMLIRSWPKVIRQ